MHPRWNEDPRAFGSNFAPVHRTTTWLFFLLQFLLADLDSNGVYSGVVDVFLPRSCSFPIRLFLRSPWCISPPPICISNRGDLFGRRVIVVAPCTYLPSQLARACMLCIRAPVCTGVKTSTWVSFRRYAFAQALYHRHYQQHRSQNHKQDSEPA